MSTANKTDATVNPCPDCPTGNDGGVGVSLSDSAINNIINILHLDATDKVRLTWLKLEATPAEIAAINKFLADNHTSTAAVMFIKEAITALMNNGEVDFDEAYIEDVASDDNYVYQGPKQYIPNPLILSNGDQIQVTFITHTTDNISSNQLVSTALIDGVKFALGQANNNLSSSDKISSINIYATTNGKHTGLNYYNGTALDINRINGKRMAETGLTNQITELQKAFDNFQYIRENFGPYFKHKFSKDEPIGNQWNYNYPVGNHIDHIHISIRK